MNTCVFAGRMFTEEQVAYATRIAKKYNVKKAIVLNMYSDVLYMKENNLTFSDLLR